MSGNRKLPFGYKMELGKIVIHPMEAVTVQEIFEKYILGASYKELVDGLRKDGISYNEGKIWNKSMITRILENKNTLDNQTVRLLSRRNSITGRKKNAAARPALHREQKRKRFSGS